MKEALLRLRLIFLSYLLKCVSTKFYLIASTVTSSYCNSLFSILPICYNVISRELPSQNPHVTWCADEQLSSGIVLETWLQFKVVEVIVRGWETTNALVCWDTEKNQR